MPRIYVADLADYNNGELRGEWIDVSGLDKDEILAEIQEMLDEKPGHEEWAIHDTEELPTVTEGTDLEHIVKIAEAVDEHDSEVVEAFLSHRDVSDLENFSDYYQGTYDSRSDFAIQLTEDLGGIENFNYPEQYMFISNTDKRVMANDEADSFMSNLSDEEILEKANEDKAEGEEITDVQEAWDIVNSEEVDRIASALGKDPYGYFEDIYGNDPKSIYALNVWMTDYNKLADDLLSTDYFGESTSKGFVVFRQEA